MPAQVYVHHVLVGSPEWWKRVWDVLKVVLLLNSKDYCIILACSKGSGVIPDGNPHLLTCSLRPSDKLLKPQVVGFSQTDQRGSHTPLSSSAVIQS